MCVSMYPAEFKGTTLVASVANHPQQGPVDVCLYGNSYKNRHNGPNAMVLHFPSEEPMGEANAIDLSCAKSVVKDIAETVDPPMMDRGEGLRTFGDFDDAKGVRVFDSGNYTIVISESPNLIPNALERVRPDRRPAVNGKLFAWYANKYPGYSIVLCCFSGREMQKADPIGFWYKPWSKKFLFAPAVDAHDGEEPRLDSEVEVDHVLAIGGPEGSVGKGSRVYYKDRLSSELLTLLPFAVKGAKWDGRWPNADFRIPRAALSEPVTGHSLYRVVKRGFVE